MTNLKQQQFKLQRNWEGKKQNKSCFSFHVESNFKVHSISRLSLCFAAVSLGTERAKPFSRAGGCYPHTRLSFCSELTLSGRVLGLKTTAIMHQLFKFVLMSGPQSTCSERGLWNSRIFRMGFRRSTNAKKTTRQHTRVCTCPLSGVSGLCSHRPPDL